MEFPWESFRKIAFCAKAQNGPHWRLAKRQESPEGSRTSITPQPRLSHLTLPYMLRLTPQSYPNPSLTQPVSCLRTHTLDSLNLDITVSPSGRPTLLVHGTRVGGFDGSKMN